MPGTSASVWPFMTWHVEVPMIATSWPGAIALAAGGVTCASTLPTATAMPAGSWVQAAARGASEPARPPSAETGWASLSAANPANPGCSAARNPRDGYCPSCQMPLYPAVQAFLVSAPVSCQMIQSAASIHRSASR